MQPHRGLWVVPDEEHTHQGGIGPLFHLLVSTGFFAVMSKTDISKRFH